MASVKRFTELVAWQRAHELQTLCEGLLRRRPLQADRKFREQLSDAASSTCRNIAEGFGRFRPRENAQYVRVAKGSANEVLALLLEAKSQGLRRRGGFLTLRNRRKQSHRDDRELSQVPRAVRMMLQSLGFAFRDYEV